MDFYGFIQQQRVSSLIHFKTILSLIIAVFVGHFTLKQKTVKLCDRSLTSPVHVLSKIKRIYTVSMKGCKINMYIIKSMEMLGDTKF